MTQTEFRPLVERVEIARIVYMRMTQRIPTRCVLTLEDVDELNEWLDEHRCRKEVPKEYIHLPHSIEPQLLGMRLLLDQYANVLRVFFQES